MNHEYNLNLLRAASWEVDKAIESLGGIDLYEEILNDFYSENIQRAKRIIEDKNNLDLKNYTIEVHSLKTECMYLGIKNLADICLKHQLKSEANDVSYINSHFDLLMSEIAKALTVIKGYLGK